MPSGMLAAAAIARADALKAACVRTAADISSRCAATNSQSCPSVMGPRFMGGPRSPYCATRGGSAPAGQRLQHLPVVDFAKVDVVTAHGKTPLARQNRNDRVVAKRLDV